MDLPLDHNFPEPILKCLEQYIPDPKLIPLQRIHPALCELTDRRLLIALHQLGHEGLVTNDYKMLLNPNSLAVLLRTNLAVFAIQGVGDDPIRATGALLLDLPAAVRAIESGRRGVFWLRPRVPQPKQPWDLFKQAAQRRNQDPEGLHREVRVTDRELAEPVLSGV